MGCTRCWAAELLAVCSNFLDSRRSGSDYALLSTEGAASTRGLDLQLLGSSKSQLWFSEGWNQAGQFVMENRVPLGRALCSPCSPSPAAGIAVPGRLSQSWCSPKLELCEFPHWKLLLLLAPPSPCDAAFMRRGALWKMHGTNPPNK